MKDGRSLDDLEVFFVERSTAVRDSRQLRSVPRDGNPADRRERHARCHGADVDNVICGCEV